ncbi:peptidase S8/S53 domain-containing protein [Echria macrotheca]|uniref:Peptidase S8/S53 domain-containing protein n=1 Tax=Echria macrotheca TaxID=438768 RepID=A0AAJ0F6C7_9PEZI|nr:peptidase S8/S53 domain-containing protein [Echria macrotheca]
MYSAAVLALLPLALAAPSGPIDRRAPILHPRGAEIIPGKYIVKLKDGATEATLDKAIGKLRKGKPQHVYKNTGFKGFAATVEDADLEALQALPDVEYIEKESVYTINAYVSQTGAPWGIARLSNKAAGSTTYTRDSSDGAGTCSYVIDTGIYTAHSDFGGRATWLANYVDSSNSDGNGHGTHVAGTIGGTTYGVAKKTKLYAVKVLSASGSGSTSGVIAGINFVASDYKTRNCVNGTVANMSLGGSSSSSMNSAAKALVDAGVFLSVAAGNDNANAQNSSPASEPSVCTVGATTNTDAKSSFSNYGAIVDVFAPGTSIKSTWIGSTSATNTISGTSMAAPHIAGLGAYLLALEGPRTPAALCSRIAALAQSGKITGLPSGTVNKLAFNGNPSA